MKIFHDWGSITLSPGRANPVFIIKILVKNSRRGGGGSALRRGTGAEPPTPGYATSYNHVHIVWNGLSYFHSIKEFVLF